jgi:hypothetical protein
LSHFVTTFRRRYGVRPSDVKRTGAIASARVPPAQRR